MVMENIIWFPDGKGERLCFPSLDICIYFSWKAIYKDPPSKMAVAFETSDMILTKEQAKHKFPPYISTTKWEWWSATILMVFPAGKCAYILAGKPSTETSWLLSQLISFQDVTTTSLRVEGWGPASYPTDPTLNHLIFEIPEPDHFNKSVENSTRLWQHWTANSQPPWPK